MNHLNRLLKVFLTLMLLIMPLVTPLTTVVASEVELEQSDENDENDEDYEGFEELPFGDDSELDDNHELEAFEEVEIREEPDLDEDPLEYDELVARTVREEAQLGVVTRGATFRRGPGSSYDAVGNLARGAELEILGSSGNWLSFRAGNQTGWLSADRVTQEARVGIITRGATFRHGPGSSYAAVGNLVRGAELEILGSSGNWLRFRTGNQTGWLSADRVARGTRRGVITRGATFRHGPGTSYDAAGNLVRGAELEILGSSGNWLRFRSGNQTGWLSADRVTQGTRIGFTTMGATFRHGPGSSYDAVGTLVRGVELEILGTSANGNWLRIRVGNQTGWVSAERVTQGTRAGATTMGATFRHGPGSSYDAAGTLVRGAALEILGSSANGNWLRIRAGNQLGWISASRVISSLPHHQEVEATLRRLIAGRNNIGISYLCLTTGRHISINGNRNFNAASTIKLPTHMLVAEAVREGRLSWNQRLTVTQADWLGGSGVLQHRVRVGQQLTLYEVMRHSIVYSDNLAHRMLTRTVIPGFVHDPVGLDNSRRQLTNAIFERYLPGQPVAGRSVITPNQLTEVLRVLYQDRSAISGYGTIINHMRNSSWNNRFNTNLARRHVAHTPGWTGTYSHDSGIFFTDHPYVLVVMTTGVGGANFISEVGDAIFRLHR